MYPFLELGVAMVLLGLFSLIFPGILKRRKLQPIGRLRVENHSLEYMFVVGGLLLIIVPLITCAIRDALSV